MKNHKGKPVYTFTGCLAIIESLGAYNDRYMFAEQHRDLFRDAEKLSKVIKLLGPKGAAFLESQMKYWENEFTPAAESSSEEMSPEPAPKKGKPSAAVMFKQSAKQSQDNSDERHHSRRNGHM